MRYRLAPIVATSAGATALVWRWRARRDLRARRAATSFAGPADGDVRLTVVLPAFDEADRIAGTIEAIRHEVITDIDGDAEIIVVDDGSSDATFEVAADAGADVVVRHETNRGKGAAVRTGVLAARGRTILFTDADLAYGPDHIPRLLEVVESGSDVAAGSRRHEQTETLVRARLLRSLGGRLIKLMTHVVLLDRYGDTQSGLKAYRSDVARDVFGRAQIEGFAFDVEIFRLCERAGYTVAEVPVRVVNSSRSSVHVVRDGLRLLRDLLEIRRLEASGVYDRGQ